MNWRWLTCLALALCLAAAGPALASEALEDLRAGFQAQQAGEQEQAVRLVTRALESGRLPPLEEAQARRLRADIHKEQRRFDLALSDYDQALAIVEKLGKWDQAAVILRGRGHAHAQRAAYDQAMADFARALRINPEDAWTYYLRGNALRTRGELEAALADYERAISRRPYHRFYYQRSLTYQRLGMYKEATADMETAVRLEPEHQQYRRRLEELRAWAPR